MAKSSLKTYTLWLLFGWLGIHHFYLHRTYQGVIWLSTWGGFGLGLVADIFQIPEYVAAANEEKHYLEKLGLEMRHSKKPPICANIFRILWLFVIGSLYRSFVLFFLPEYLPPIVYILFVPIGNVIGFYLVMNIGRMECRLKHCVYLSYIGQVAEWYNSEEVTHPGLCSLYLPAIILFLAHRKWNKQPLKKGKLYKAKWFFGACILLSAMLVSGAYFHLKIEVDGETIYLREGVKNFLNSPAWAEFKTIMHELWSDYWEEGWDNASSNFYRKADFEGEGHALEVMGLEQGCGVQEIRKRFRELSLIWHPDKHFGEDKKEAQDKFIEIENAKEVLIKIANRRHKH